MGLLKILFAVVAFVILRRLVRGLFVGVGGGERRRETTARRDAAPREDPRQEGPPQEIEEADYEELE